MPHVVTGAICTWWGEIGDASRTKLSSSSIPCCPHCGSPLFEFESPRAWWKMVHKFDADHPGYNQFISWLRGRCFPTIYLAKIQYESETGRKVAL